METKHSPRPWVWVDRLLQGHAKYAGPHDRGGFIDANGEMVCWFGDGEQYYPTDGEPPSDDDKRLISAAPDLLASCLWLKGYAEAQVRRHPDAPDTPQWQALLDAIAKATQP